MASDWIDRRTDGHSNFQSTEVSTKIYAIYDSWEHVGVPMQYFSNLTYPTCNQSLSTSTTRFSLPPTTRIPSSSTTWNSSLPRHQYSQWSLFSFPSFSSIIFLLTWKPTITIVVLAYIKLSLSKIFARG